MELISILVKICQALQDENEVLREILILLAHHVRCGDSGLDTATLGPHQAQTCHGHTRTVYYSTLHISDYSCSPL